MLVYMQSFEKLSDIKFHENPSSGSWGVPRRQTDRHDEGNNRFSQLSDRIWKRQNAKTFIIFRCTAMQYLN